MPTYDYECATCDKVIEVFQSMSDPALTACPECGGKKIKRMVSGGAGLIFKGSGFYVNDSKKSSSNKSNSSTPSKPSAASTDAPAKAATTATPPPAKNSD